MAVRSGQIRDRNSATSAGPYIPFWWRPETRKEERPGPSGVQSRLGGDGAAQRAAQHVAVFRQNEVGEARRVLGTEARAVEHAVMTDGGLQIMGAPVGRN